LHDTFLNKPEFCEQFVRGLLPYLSVWQAFILTQRLIPIDLETCTAEGTFLHRKTLLLLLLVALTQDVEFGKHYSSLFFELHVQKKEFYRRLLADRIPPTLAYHFQSIFHIIEKEQCQSLAKLSSQRKLDQRSQTTLSRILESKKTNAIYANMKAIDCVELFILNFIKLPIANSIASLQSIEERQLLEKSLSALFNRNNGCYLDFCEKYFKNINAVFANIPFVDKSPEQILRDQHALMSATQNASIATFFHSKLRISFDRFLANKKPTNDTSSPVAPRGDLSADYPAQKQGLVDVLQGYMDNVACCPDADTIVANLEYLRMTLLTLRQRNSEGRFEIDPELHTAFSKTVEFMQTKISEANLSASESIKDYIDRIHEMLCNKVKYDFSSTRSNATTRMGIASQYIL